MQGENSHSPLRVGVAASDDQALFTKRPLQCLSCASCDKPLKTVSPTPSGQYSQWKKLPARDPMDRLAKAGTGFSKMLQNIKNPVIDYGETTEET